MKLKFVFAFVLFAFGLTLMPAVAEDPVVESPTATTPSTETAATDAQKSTSGTAEELKPEPYKPEEFPQWAHDLRRGEIIAFGSLPFTLFFVKTAIDSFRYADNDWDRRYAPWPLKSTGAIEMDEGQRIAALVAAGVGSVLLAVVDHIIVKIRRNSAEKAAHSKIPPRITTERDGWPPSVDLPPPSSAPPAQKQGEKSGVPEGDR
jgi:hypothetical protein